MDINLFRAMRRDVNTMRTLLDAGHLSADHVDDLTARLLVTIAEAEKACEQELGEPEYFHVTLAGIHALDAPIAETPPRDYGRLRCIDGGLS